MSSPRTQRVDHRCNRAQGLLALGVAVAVVDALEVVHIEQGDAVVTAEQARRGIRRPSAAAPFAKLSGTATCKPPCVPVAMLTQNRDRPYACIP